MSHLHVWWSCTLETLLSCPVHGTAVLRRGACDLLLCTQMIIPIACRTQEGAQRLLAAIKARAFQAEALAPALKRCASRTKIYSALAVC